MSLELLLLTKLSSMQLVFGKWAALTSQCALVVTALLPYLVLQYYVNNSDIVKLFGLVYLCCMGSAVMVSLGVCNSALVRGKTAVGLRIIGILAVLWAVGVLGSSAMRLSSRSGLTDLPLRDVAVILIYTPLTVFQLLLIGAAKIAPFSENYTAAKRLTTLLVLALTWLLLAVGFGRRDLVVLLSLVFVVPMFVSSCFETVHPMLIRRLRVKRLTPWLSYSGWPQGMIFSFLTGTAYLFLLASVGVIRPQSTFGCATFIFIGLVLPRALMLKIPSIFGNSFLAYMIIQAVVVIVPAAISSVAPNGTALDAAYTLSPLVVGIIALGKTHAQSTLLTAFVSVGVVLVLLQAALAVYREVTRAAADGLWKPSNEI